jgi:hypothetical protein
MGRGGVSRENEGLVAGASERGQAGGARGGELQATRDDAGVEKDPFPEANEELPPFVPRYSLRGFRSALEEELGRLGSKDMGPSQLRNMLLRAQVKPAELKDRGVERLLSQKERENGRVNPSDILRVLRSVPAYGEGGDVSEIRLGSDLSRSRKMSELGAKFSEEYQRTLGARADEGRAQARADAYADLARRIADSLSAALPSLTGEAGVDVKGYVRGLVNDIARVLDVTRDVLVAEDSGEAGGYYGTREQRVRLREAVRSVAFAMDDADHGDLSRPVRSAIFDWSEANGFSATGEILGYITNDPELSRSERGKEVIGALVRGLTLKSASDIGAVTPYAGKPEYKGYSAASQSDASEGLRERPPERAARYEETLVHQELPGNYQSPHFVRNRRGSGLVMHNRATRGVDKQGRKYTIVEELQSDLHQRARETGYSDESERTAGQRTEEVRTALADIHAKFGERARDLLDRTRDHAGWHTRRDLLLTLSALDSIGVDGYIKDGEYSDLLGIADGSLPTVAWANAKGDKLDGEFATLANDVQEALPDKLKDRQAAIHWLRPALKGPHGVPRAAFSENWENVGLKMLLRDAVDSGSDVLYLTTGAKQADRWSSATRGVVDSITMTPTKEDRSTAHVVGTNNGKTVYSSVLPVRSDNPDTHTITSVLGKEMARRYEEGETRFEGENLVVGGRGFVEKYDNQYPKTLQKIARQWDKGAEVKLTVGPTRVPAWTLEITEPIRAGVKAGQTLYSMGGASAKTADREALKRAQKMVRAGAADDEAWRETGWRRFPDGRWRFEISDHDAKLNDDVYARIPLDFKIGIPQVTLGELLDHPDLFAAYPGLRDIRVVRASQDDGGTVAALDKKANKILLYSRIDREPEGQVSFLLHEIQHAIQDTEGFAKGGSPETVARSVPESEARQYAEQEAESLERSAEELEVEADELDARARLYAPIAQEMKAIRDTMFSEFSRREERIASAMEKARAELGDGLSLTQMEKLTADVRNGRHPGALMDRANEIRRRAIAMREDAGDARRATGPALQRYVDRHADTFEFYKRLAGEAEARQTQARQRLTPEERRARDPYQDFDVPPEKQLVDRRRYSVRGEPVVGEDGIRRLTIFHMSNRDGLEEVDPKFQGTGQAGAEMKRRYDDGFEPFSNWYTGEPGTVVEAHRFGGKPMYESEVELTNEPGGVIEADRVEGRTAAQLKAEGYTGVYFPHAGQVQMLVPVKPSPVGTAPRPGRPTARGDEFYREATGREAMYSRRQEETPEFKAWFGRSAATDAMGKPLWLYHGTQAEEDFGVFSLERVGSSEGDTGWYGAGIYLTPDPETASTYAEFSSYSKDGMRVMPLYARVEHPFLFDDSSPARFKNTLEEIARLDGWSVSERREILRARNASVAFGSEGKVSGHRLSSVLRGAGYDGVFVYKDGAASDSGIEEVVVFSPEHIKSATGNTGAFDPADPDIRYSRRDPAESQVSWEALPGKSTGWLRGIHAAPYALRAAFTADIDTKVLRDALGRDRIARLFGVEETESVVAPGYWKGERNPSRQAFVRVPDGPDGLERVKAYAAARGYVLRQEAVGLHLARNTQAGERPNGYHTDIGRMPTAAEYADFVSGLNKIATQAERKKGVFVPVPTHAGINMWTWDGSISDERLRAVNDAALANIRSGATGEVHPLVVDSDLIENDWTEAPNGEIYVQRFTPSAGSPGVQGSLDQLRAAADKVGRQWASRHGWGTKLGAAEPAVPRDLESLVGRDVNPGLKGARRAKLFKDIARMIDGRALADMKFAAESGRAMKGWYRDSWQAIEKLFGEDAERFTSLLAALSPQQGVKENLKMAVDAWQTWVEAGRPSDPESVKSLFPVVARKWSDSKKQWSNQYAIIDMEARFNNTITALTDAPGTELSGNKVESFRRNLRGDFDAVTNDTWMAYFSEWQQKVFNTETGYLAGSYLVRRAAKKLGWTPAEVQETVWTFFRELASRTGVGGAKATDIAATMTMGDVISGSDSFTHLVRDTDVQKRLTALGLDVNSLPDLPRLSEEEASALAVRPEDRDSGVSRRVVGRAQRQADASWARGEIKAAGVEGLNDSDPAALKRLAAALGIPTEGRTRNQTIAALRAYADPTRYSRRDSPLELTRSTGPADIPLNVPQVESVVDRLVESEGFVQGKGASYTPKPLDSDKPRPQAEVEREAKVADFAVTDEQIQRKVTSGRPLTDKEVMLTNIRMETRRAEMDDATTRRLEAEAMSAAERAERGIDLDRLRMDEVDATLAHINMVLARKNAGTALGRGLAAMARKMEPGTKLTPDTLTMKLSGIPGIHPKSIAELYRKYQDGDIEGFRDGVRRAIEPTWQHKWAEYYRGSLLTGIPTHMANFTGNIAEPALRAAETVAAAGVDKIVSTLRGTPRERFLGEVQHELRGQMKVVAPAFRQLAADLYRQVLLQKEPTLDLGRKFDHQVGAIGGRLGTLVRTPFRALGVADDFFKSLGFAAETEKRAYREARKEGLKGRDAERRAQEIIQEASTDPVGRWRGLMDAAHRGTLERVFQEDPAKIVRLAMQVANDHPLAAAIVVPFLRTPGNITRTGWRRSPMGLLLPGDFQSKTKMFRAQQAELRAGRTPEGEIVSRGDVEDALARGAVGVALATTFGLLAAAGMMTGSGPTDDKEKNAKRATGWQPYSFVIPGAGGDGKPLYVPFSRFEPTASLLGNIADAFELGDERSVLDKVTTSISTNWTNKTYFKGLNDAASAITTPNRAAKRFAGSIAAAHVPNIIAKTADAADPVLRETRSESGLAGLGETVKRGITRRIPGVSRTAEPMYTATGEEAAKPGTSLTRFMSPVQATSLRPGTELEAHMAKIHEVPGDIPDAVAIPKDLFPKNADVDWTGTRIFLTNEERAFLAKARRDAASQLRAELKQIQLLPVDEQRATIRRTFSRAQKAATKELWLKSPALRERARRKLER